MYKVARKKRRANKFHCIAVVFIVLIGMNSAKAQKQGSTWAVNCSGQLAGAFRALLDKNNAPTNASIIDIRNENEIPKVSGSFKVSGAYRVFSFFQLCAGFEYFNLGWKTQKLPLYFAQPQPDLPLYGRFIEQFHYLGIPIQVKVDLIRKNWALFASTEVEQALLLSVRSRNILYYTENNETSSAPSMDEYKRINTFWGIGVGAKRLLSNKISIELGLSGRYGLTQIINAPISARLYSFGLNMGMSYAF